VLKKGVRLYKLVSVLVVGKASDHLKVMNKWLMNDLLIVEEKGKISKVKYEK
jgi:hypothetical protein